MIAPIQMIDPNHLVLPLTFRGRVYPIHLTRSGDFLCASATVQTPVGPIQVQAKVNEAQVRAAVLALLPESVRKLGAFVLGGAQKLAEGKVVRDVAHSIAAAVARSLPGSGPSVRAATNLLARARAGDSVAISAIGSIVAGAKAGDASCAQAFEALKAVGNFASATVDMLPGFLPSQAYDAMRAQYGETIEMVAGADGVFVPRNRPRYNLPPLRAR
jgi:hypothetical protein